MMALLSIAKARGRPAERVTRARALMAFSERALR